MNLNDIPEQVHASDEDMYEKVCLLVCEEMNVDPRFADGNIQDEYHECWFENYEDQGYEFDDVTEENPDADLIPREVMLEFARSDVGYYASHDPEHHVDNDVTQPAIVTHETWGDEIQCPRCEADAQFAFEDALISLGVDDRISRIRAYVDTVIPESLRPYDVRQSANNVFYYELRHNDELIGSAQFNDSIDVVSIPLVQYTNHELFLNAHPDYTFENGRLVTRQDDES